MLKISGGKAELRTDQLKEVSIAIDKLSTADQAFLKKFQQQAGLAALPVPDLPAVIDFESNRSATSRNSEHQRNGRDAQTEKTRLQLAADPIRRGLDIAQAGVGFPSLDNGERVSSLIALGGADNWVLASIGEEANRPTRLLWVSLAKQSVKRIQMLPPGEILVDYHAASRQMLTYSQRSESAEDAGGAPFNRPSMPLSGIPLPGIPIPGLPLTGMPAPGMPAPGMPAPGRPSPASSSVLTIWQTDPNVEEAKAVVSWNARLPDDKASASSVPWARFASNSQVLQRTTNHRILAWNFVERKLSWDTAQESFFAPEPNLSAGGKYLLLPEDSGLRILDVSTGNVVGQVPMSRCTGVAVHHDGRKLAVAGDDNVYIIDITGAQQTRKINAASVLSPFGVKFDWVGEDLLCFDNTHRSAGMVLYSIELALPLWQYHFDTGAYWHKKGARPHSIVKDHLVYAATFEREGRPGLAVGAVAMPGEKARDAIANTQRDTFLAIKAGTKFRVEVLALDHSSEIRQALEKEVQANGWEYDESSPNVIRAEYKRGEPTTAQYELRSMSTGGRDMQSATVTPYIATVKVMLGNDEAWGMMSSTGPPPFLMLRQGESVQDHINASGSGSPNWKFFQSVDIPHEILHPKKKGGVGRTSVTNRGLIEEVIE